MKNARGFTLIELMITIAILAIIMGIAIPAYNGQVEKSRRADAITGLLQAAQQLERCYTRFNGYDPTGSDGNSMCTIPETSPDGHYAISTTERTATTFTLEATPQPQGAQASDADKCPKFTLDHLGRKTPAPGADSNRCWGSN